LFRLFTCYLIPACLNAQGRAPEAINPKSGAVYAPAHAAQWLNATAELPAGSDPLQVLRQFNSHQTEARNKSPQTNGVELMDYIPGNAFMALVKPSASLKNISAAGIKGIVEVAPDWKADRSLWTKITGFGNARVQVLVSFHPGIAEAEIMAFIAKEGGTLV